MQNHLLRKSGEFFYPSRMTKILVALAFVLGVVLVGLSTWVHGRFLTTLKRA